MITWLREHKVDGMESSYYGIIMVETWMIRAKQHPIHSGMVKATLSLMEMTITMTMNPHTDDRTLR
jgi:hypothetical protein